MRHYLKALGGVALLLATAGCAKMNFGWGSFYAPDDILRQGDITTARELSSSNPFNEGLRQGYLDLAEQEVAVEYDWRNAGIFARKAIAAGQDRPPEPSMREDWVLSEQYAGTFDEWRANLMAALDDGARERAPEPAARAQVAFDCWAEEAEEPYHPDEMAACESAFLAAMQELQRPAPTPTGQQPLPEPTARDYLVFFDWNRSDIRSDSAEILDRVVTAIRDLQATTVELIGHADRSGPDNYNQRLSEQRAEAVRQYLSGENVSTGAMTTSGRGETDPRVPTPDGVREQENRRVEIHLK
jgi:OOP family OmpA-OmpF porin